MTTSSPKGERGSLQNTANKAEPVSSETRFGAPSAISQTTEKRYIVDWHDDVSASDILEVLMACEWQISEEIYKRLSKNAKSYWREKEND